MDIYGNVVTAVYTSHRPNTVEDSNLEWTQGQETRTGKPIFEGDGLTAPFEDGSAERLFQEEEHIPSHQTLFVTFVPEPNFVGTATGVVIIP